MINDILEKVGDRVQNFKGVILIGKEGFVVDKHGIENEDVETLVVEFLNIIRKLHSLLSKHEQTESLNVIVDTDENKYILKQITPDYYIFLGVSEKTNTGKANYELTKAIMDLKAELKLL